MAHARKAKRRAPLMESDTEAALRRRGTELVGLVLIALAALAAAMIWTYSPDDPSLFSATDEAPRNALGLVGASLADPLHRALGWAAYGIAAALRGLGPALPAARRRGAAPSAARSPLPVALLVAAAFAATHVPLAGWPHDYGLGGLLGDAALGALLSVVAARPRRRRCGSSRSLLAARLRRSAPATRSASPGPRRAASCASSARARWCSTPAPTA